MGSARVAIRAAKTPQRGRCAGVFQQYGRQHAFIATFKAKGEAVGCRQI